MWYRRLYIGRCNEHARADRRVMLEKTGASTVLEKFEEKRTRPSFVPHHASISAARSLHRPIYKRPDVVRVEAPSPVHMPAHPPPHV